MKLAIPLILGILFYEFYFALAVYTQLLFALLILLLITLIFFHSRSGMAISFNLLFSLSCFIFLFFVGVISAKKAQNKVAFRFIPENIETRCLAEVIEINPSSSGAQVKLNLLELDQQVDENLPIGVQVYVKNIKGLKEGYIVSGQFIFQKIDQGVLELPFNYAEYLAKQGIFYQSFIDSLHVVKIPAEIFNPQILKSKLLDFTERLRVDKKHLGLLQALIIAEKSNLDAKQKELFAQAGIMHLLAVSGLHVGILYLLINHALFFLNGKLGLRIFKALIILITLWLFAILCGLGPSVKRACFMFSLVLLADLFQRNSIIINAVFGSALILLIDNSSLLFDPGFQLSYSAVLGILTIQPKLSKLYQPKYWLFRKILDISYVSIAAQLATLGISLYYFHQYPTWFLLSNLLAIPLSFVLVSLFIVVLILGEWSISLGLDLILNEILGLLVNISEWIQYLPFPSFSGIYLNEADVLLIYLSLVLLVYRFYFRFPYFFQFQLAFILIALIFKIDLNSPNEEYKSMTLYASKSSRILMLSKGNKANLIALNVDYSQYDFKKCQVFLESQGLDLISNESFFKAKKDSMKTLVQYNQRGFLWYSPSKPKLNSVEFNDWFKLWSNGRPKTDFIYLSKDCFGRSRRWQIESIATETEQLIRWWY